MRKKVKFENGIQEMEINSDAGCKQLQLISATINNVEDMRVIPSVEFILLNDKVLFKSYSNLVLGTNNLNCFDLLLTATNNPALSNETFHTLKCVVPDNAYDAEVVIDMEFEIE
jgi:hypothetical protein